MLFHYYLYWFFQLSPQPRLLPAFFVHLMASLTTSADRGPATYLAHLLLSSSNRCSITQIHFLSDKHIFSFRFCWQRLSLLYCRIIYIDGNFLHISFFSETLFWHRGDHMCPCGASPQWGCCSESRSVSSSGEMWKAVKANEDKSYLRYL